MVKLICTDIDGTLLNKNREVDAYTVKVFKQLAGKFEIILASSRMPKALFYIQNELDIEEMPLICYNGALILSRGETFDNYKIIDSITILPEITHSVIELAESQNVHISIFYNNTWIASEMDLWTEREMNNTRVKPDLILSDLSKKEKEKKRTYAAHKIMLMGASYQIDSIEEALVSKPTVAICRSKDTYLEITPIGTDKSKGLQILLNKVNHYREIKMENIMAFGDNYNDFELLKDVKYGIAVANGQQKIKDIAYAVTKSNYDNGVAFYLDETFLK